MENKKTFPGHDEIMAVLKPVKDDVANIVMGGLSIPKTIFDVPQEAVKLYQEQGLKEGTENFMASLPKAVWESSKYLAPQSMKDLANWEGIKQMPEQIRKLANESGGYGKAALSFLRELPSSIPEGAQNELHQVRKAIDSFAGHPISEALGWMAVQHIINSMGSNGKTPQEPIKTTSDQIKFAEKSATQFLDEPSVKAKIEASGGILPDDLIKGRVDDYAAHLNRSTPGLGDVFKQQLGSVKDITVEKLHHITSIASKLAEVADDIKSTFPNESVRGLLENIKG